jgi:predicted phage baseplate assembly protein
MPLPYIDLDDRQFEDLFNEARRRIPAYTPEWTDHNDSDPGITLLQLAAFFQEMIIWRLNRVPQKNYHKFLELVGLDLLPAAPAQADLTFTLSKGAVSADIPAGTQVALGGGGGGPPILFETQEPLTAVGAALAAVQSFDAAQFTLQTDANAANGPPGYAALSATPQKDAALYLGFDQAFPAATIRLTFYIGGSAVPAPVQGGATTTAALSPPVQAYWEYWAGDAAGWERLTLLDDGTQALTKSGAVLFTAPTDAQARQLGQLMKPDDKALFWLRYRIDQVLGAGYETPPMVQAVMINTVPSINAATETDVLLGAANGRPNQTVQLPRFPVLPLLPGVAGCIAVDEGDGNGYVTWTEVGDFAGSGPNDRHYVLDHPTGLVHFGDGKNGRIPRWLSGNGSNRDDADVVNIKATSFRWGGGVAGNAGANTISSLRASIPFVSSVTNLRPSFGGADEESVAAAQVRTPQVLRTANRAVTGDDFAFIAKETPGAQIARAQAFPLLNPSFRMRRSTADGTAQAEVPVPGAVTIVVVPESTEPMPMPSAGTLQLVAAWLDQHRLLTAELFVAPPRYREVSIEASLVVDPAADLGIVHDAVIKTLTDYFHPLRGGRDGTGWDFGGTLYFSETYRQILDVPGVLRIVTGSLKTYVDNALQPAATDVLLEPDELVYSLVHHITANYQ